MKQAFRGGYSLFPLGDYPQNFCRVSDWVESLRNSSSNLDKQKAAKVDKMVEEIRGFNGVTLKEFPIVEVDLGDDNLVKSLKTLASSRPELLKQLDHLLR